MSTDRDPTHSPQPLLQARGLIKRFGRVTALDRAHFDLYPGEVLGIIGDNGAGKSTLIKILSGALEPDAGEMRYAGGPVNFKNPMEARQVGIETVYQDLALSPALNIVENVFLGRERRVPGFVGAVFRRLDKDHMHRETDKRMSELGLLTVTDLTQAVETLSGGQRQGVAIARAAIFGSRVIIMDEPTAALGVNESARVLDLIRNLRNRGTPIVLVSHNMPHVWEVADRIHVHRLGRRVAVIRPDTHSMTDGVAIMTGASDPSKEPKHD